MNLKQVESILELFERVSIHKLVVGDEKMSLTLTRGQSPDVVMNAPAAIAHTEAIASKPILLTLKSTGVGFAKVKVKLGDAVKKSQVVFSITSMNIEHDYKSEQAGIVREIFIDDGVPVEFGQPLIDLEVG